MQQMLLIFKYGHRTQDCEIHFLLPAHLQKGETNQLLIKSIGRGVFHCLPSSNLGFVNSLVHPFSALVFSLVLAIIVNRQSGSRWRAS